MAPSQRYLCWWEPRWSYRPRIIDELREARLPASLLRATLPAILIGALAMAWLKHRLPDIGIEPIRLLALSIFALIGSLAALVAILWLIPPMISLTKKALVIQHGQSTSPIPWADIERVTINLADRKHPVLVIERFRPRRKSRRIGIARRIDAAVLGQFLEAAIPGRVTTTGAP